VKSIASFAYRNLSEKPLDEYRSFNETVTVGARRNKACAELEISDRFLRRWTKDGQTYADQRHPVTRPAQANKLSAAESTTVLETYI